MFNLFQQNKFAPDCKCTINIFNPSTRMWDSVTVDDCVPVVKGEPLIAKPQDHKMWVLLLEKAFSKWVGSYCQIQGAYCMVAYMLFIDCGGPCISERCQTPQFCWSRSQRHDDKRSSLGRIEKGRCIPSHYVRLDGQGHCCREP